MFAWLTIVLQVVIFFPSPPHSISHTGLTTL